MKNFKNIRKIIANHKTDLRKRFNIKVIGVFGSFVRKEQNPKSDIDILIEFKPGHKTFDNYMELKFFLEELLGLRVDLVMKSAIRKELKKAILAEVVYA